MKLTFISLFLSFTLSLTLQADTSAEALYDAKCASCHIKTRPVAKSDLVAPPIMGVMLHVKMRYKTKEEAVKFINDYVMNPQKDKSVCKKGKLKRFGLMPSQKGVLTDEELNTISEWVYDNFPPAGFKGMNQRSNKSCGN